MKNLLSKIYEQVVCLEADSVELGEVFTNQVEALLEPLKVTKSEDEVEEIRELIYNASNHAEAHGFMLGVRFMAELVAETMKKND